MDTGIYSSSEYSSNCALVKIMDIPRFSLIVICRNAANYVVRALSSIAKQSFDMDRVEVVFVDDGSSDFSGDIAERFGADLPHFKLVRTGKEHGSGCGGARNAGIKEATGEYIWHLDVDDFIMPNALKLIDEALVKADEKNGKTDVCLFSFRTDRMVNGKRECKVSNQLRSTLQNGVLGPVAAWAKVIRREVAVPLPAGVMAQDAAWHFLQYDKFETMASVASKDLLYVYDRTNTTATSTTQEWTANNPRTLEQLAFGNEVQKLGLNDRFFSDAIRSLADMYDVRNLLTKPWVKAAWRTRFRLNYANVMTGRFTH